MLCMAPPLAADHAPLPLSAQDKASISAALTMLRQPRFSCVEALGLGKSAKLGKTGAASLAKVCPHLRELDLSSVAVSNDDCASLHAAVPELAGLSFCVDSSTVWERALGNAMDPLYGLPLYTTAKRLCDAVSPFTSLLYLQISWDSGAEDFGDRVCLMVAEHCPNLQLLALVSCFLENIPTYCQYWDENDIDDRVRGQARTQNLTDLGVAALLGGCPQLQSLTLKPACFLETAFQKISDQLKASPPLLKLKHLTVTDNPALSSALGGSLLRLSLATNRVKRWHARARHCVRTLPRLLALPRHG